jgi:formamidopyrimidine-DNA glycosylase
MSIELPEALILARQMNEELVGKVVKSYHLKDCQRLQRTGFVNKDARDFDMLVGGTIDSVTSKGNSMLVKLDNGTNLVLAPEYGGVVLYHADESKVPSSYHLRLDFADRTSLTVRLTGMGCLNSVPDRKLKDNYVYRRDFLGRPSPIGEGFAFESFSRMLGVSNRMLKSCIVGKDAVVTGLGNSLFQEIAYKAKIHPKAKASELDEGRKRALYGAVREVVQSRIEKGGKDDFVDLHGKRGRHEPSMGSHMKGRACPRCGTAIDSMSIAGGPSYFCPSCQR